MPTESPTFAPAPTAPTEPPSSTRRQSKNDTTADTLSGTTDLDWFFQSAGDVLDAINGDVQTSIL